MKKANYSLIIRNQAQWLLMLSVLVPMTSRADLGLIDPDTRQSFAIYGSKNSWVAFRTCGPFTAGPDRSCATERVDLRMSYKIFDSFFTRSLQESDETYLDRNKNYQSLLEKKDSIKSSIDQLAYEVRSLQKRANDLTAIMKTIDKKLENPNLPNEERRKLTQERAKLNSELAVLPGQIANAQRQLKTSEAELVAIGPPLAQAKADLANRVADLNALKSDLFEGLSKDVNKVFLPQESAYSLLKNLYSLKPGSVPVATCEVGGYTSSRETNVSLKLSDGIYPSKAALTLRYIHWNDYRKKYEYKSFVSYVVPASTTYHFPPYGSWGLDGARLEYVGLNGGCR